MLKRWKKHLECSFGKGSLLMLEGFPWLVTCYMLDLEPT